MNCKKDRASIQSNSWVAKNHHVPNNSRYRLAAINDSYGQIKITIKSGVQFYSEKRLISLYFDINRISKSVKTLIYNFWINIGSVLKCSVCSTWLFNAYYHIDKYFVTIYIIHLQNLSSATNLYREMVKVD